jgi:hypothetical protein
MRHVILGLSLGGLTLGLAGCVYQPVPVAPPPPQPVYYAAPGYYAEPAYAYPAYGYYGGPAVGLNFDFGRGGGRWR